MTWALRLACGAEVDVADVEDVPGIDEDVDADAAVEVEVAVEA